MKKEFLSFVCLAAFAVVPCVADDGSGDVKLVYPITAADTELDDSTPAKRTTPPVREADEYDPVTPIGQIRGILDNLNALREQNAALLERVGALQIGENRDVIGALERGFRNQETIGTNVDALIESSKSIGAKIETIQKTTDNLRASLESIQKTAASVEKIRTSRWTDYAVGVILALVIVQLVWKVGAVVVDGIKRRAAQYQEFAAFIREKQQAENAQK